MANINKFEIPDRLKKLYRHWEKHNQPITVKSDIILPDKLLYLISERMRVWEKKESGQKPPFTKDPILQKYRFCNVYRELDRQTIDIHADLLGLRDDFQLWLLNIAFHRFICRPITVSGLNYTTPGLYSKKVGRLNFDYKKNNKVYKRLIDYEKPKYGNAYVFPISVIQKSDYPTREEFFCFYLPKIIPKVAMEIEKIENLSINKALEILLPVFGFNFKFHWTEILIDVAYQYPEKINLFEDFHIGPGALPTAKLVNPNMDPIELINECVGVKLNDFPHLTFNGKPISLSAENWEGIFCESRKYVNLKSGKGRVRKFSSN